MKSFIALSTLSLLPLISASPIPFGTPDQQQYYYPATTNVYNSHDGSIDADAEFGTISRSKDNSTPELSTLVAFYMYEPSGGKTCRFNFELDGDYTFDYDSQGRLPEFDVFVSQAKISDDVAGVPGGAPNNQRRESLGRMRVVPGGQAQVVFGKFEFKCPEVNVETPYMWEVVAVGESAKMKWSKTDGPWISYF